MEVEYYEKIEQGYSFGYCGCYFMYISDDGYGVWFRFCYESGGGDPEG